MKILLTGATGFIGRHVLKQLLAKNYDVLCTRRNTSDIGCLGPEAEKCSWIDTGEEQWTSRAAEFMPEVIIHLAWGGVDAANRGNWTKQIQNLLFQQTLLDIALKTGVKKMIGVGSQAEYGTFDGCVDELYPAHPNTAYGAAKLAAMELMKSFCEANHIAWYWFRLFSCFGEGEAGNWLIPSTIQHMLKGGSMNFTPGEQKYAYLYIGEVAAALVAAAGKNAPGGVYNISSDQVISIKELLLRIQAAVNPAFVLRFGALPYRPGQSMWMQGDTAKLKTHIYTPDCKDFDAKLKQTILYYTHPR